jgi:hypothetical protein
MSENMIWLSAGIGSAFVAGICFAACVLFVGRTRRPKIQPTPSQYTIDNSWGRPPWNDHARW